MLFILNPYTSEGRGVRGILDTGIVGKRILVPKSIFLPKNVFLDVRMRFFDIKYGLTVSDTFCIENLILNVNNAF